MLFGTLASLVLSRIADAASLTHRPHGFPSPRTSPTTAWKTRARSARPANVTLSRTPANHERIAFPARRVSQEPPGTATTGSLPRLDRAGARL